MNLNLGLESWLPYVLYFGALVVLLLTVFWRPIVGIYFLLLLIPLQTVRYRANELPLGASLVGIMLLGVVLGLMGKGQRVFPNAPWTKLLGTYAVFTFGSMCLGSSYLQTTLPFPVDELLTSSGIGGARFAAWQEYMVMPALLLLTIAVSPSKRQMQVMICIMCLATLALDKTFWNTVSDRDFSTYNEEFHEEGAGMGYAGGNGLAAFTAQASLFLLALAAFERRLWVRIGYYALALYSSVCLMYSFSRGGYAALLVGFCTLGILKDRKLLLVLAIFLTTWTAIVPPAVQQRVTMTYDAQNGDLDTSSELRLSLWSNAMDVFENNVIIGTGFNTYAYMHLNRRKDGSGGYYADTHNYFVKVLIETGVVGLVIFLWLLGRAFGEGYRLFRRAQDPLFASLGLGLICWLVCSIVANLFGDRWTFLQVNGYMWVITGMVARSWQLEQASVQISTEVLRDEDKASTACLPPSANLPEFG